MCVVEPQLPQSIMQHQQQQQQQQHQQENYNREEEYLQAQRAAVESVLVGRETLEHAHRQGEQLDRAEGMADETQYKLDKAGRMLRGMTWSGWVANMFTKDIAAPDFHMKPQKGGAHSPPTEYENIPASCKPAAQAVQNYHANVKVLESCETNEQRETCTIICNGMYEAAVSKIAELKKCKDVEAYALEFESHLEILKQRQERVSELVAVEVTGTRTKMSPVAQPSSPASKHKIEKAELMPAKNPDKQTPPKRVDPVLQLQDDHLKVISGNLGELGLIAQSLNKTVDRQNQTIDKLDTKADNIVEKSKMVTRRADRLIQKKSWTPVKPTFSHHVSIRHVATGRYLTVVNGSLFLVPKFHKEAAVFGLWKRQGEIFGLQNSHSRRWMGQNVFGSLACSANSFGRREEWEAGDADWTNTRLLCASAGWGAGGYLLVRPSDSAVLIGGSSVEERKRADVWCIQEYVAE